MAINTFITNDQPRHIIRHTLKMWVSHLLVFKKIIAISATIKIFANIITNILVPIQIGVLINYLANGNSDKGFIEITFIKIGLLLIAGLFLEYIWSRLVTHYLVRVRGNLEVDTFNKLTDKNWTFHAESFTGAVVSQFTRYIGAFQHFHDSLFRELFSILINFVASVFVTFYISPIIGIAMITWTVTYVYIIFQLSKRRFHKKQVSSKNDSKVTGYLADTLSNIMTIKIFARESFENRQFKNMISSKTNSTEQAWIWTGLTTLIISVMMAVLNISVLLISTYSITNGIMSLGGLVLLQVLTVRLSMQLWQLGGILRDFDRSFAESNEMTEILTYVPAISDPKNPTKSKIKNGAIELKNVSFQYPDENSIPTLFKNLSLSIKPGEKVGIVGPSGSGKSTILKLIMRLAEPSDGKVLIDGINIANLKRAKLRSAISFVPQEPVLFHRSIIDNIRYSNPDADQSEIEQATKKSRAKIFIDRLPNGYETVVGERGIKLSAGQRQRIAIARAMIKSSPILMLDEATSAIDSESEKLIQQALDKLMNKRTTIVVAHRFSTIKKMDRIIYMSYGKILEQGTHKELIAKKGAYAKLWAHQTDAFIEFE